MFTWLFLSNLDSFIKILIMNFWRVKIELYFHKYFFNEFFLSFSNFFAQRAFWKIFNWGFVHVDFVRFSLRFLDNIYYKKWYSCFLM
jgi:hypothetical protein